MELKACPFCGDDEPLQPSERETYCTECSATVPNDNWNTRPIEDRLNARVRELEGALEKITKAPSWIASIDIARKALEDR